MSTHSIKCNQVMKTAFVDYKFGMEAAMNFWNQREERPPTMEELEGIHAQLKKTLLEEADKEMDEYHKKCWILPGLKRMTWKNYRKMLDRDFDRYLVRFKEFNECQLELHGEKESFAFLSAGIGKLTEELGRCGENEETRKNELEQQINEQKEAREESTKKQEQLERKLEILMKKYELKMKGTVDLMSTNEFVGHSDHTAHLVSIVSEPVGIGGGLIAIFGSLFIYGIRQRKRNKAKRELDKELAEIEGTSQESTSNFQFKEEEVKAVQYE